MQKQLLVNNEQQTKSVRLSKGHWEMLQVIARKKYRLTTLRPNRSHAVSLMIEDMFGELPSEVVEEVMKFKGGEVNV